MTAVFTKPLRDMLFQGMRFDLLNSYEEREYRELTAFD